MKLQFKSVNRSENGRCSAEELRCPSYQVNVLICARGLETQLNLPPINNINLETTYLTIEVFRRKITIRNLNVQGETTLIISKSYIFIKPKRWSFLKILLNLINGNSLRKFLYKKMI